MFPNCSKLLGYLVFIKHFFHKKCAHHDPSLIQIFHKLNPNTNSSGIKYTKVGTIEILSLRMDEFDQNELSLITYQYQNLKLKRFSGPSTERVSSRAWGQSKPSMFDN